METNRTNTTNELSELFNISNRYVQKIAKRLNIPKTNNKYLFSTEDIERIEGELANEPTNQSSEPTHEPEIIELENDQPEIIELEDDKDETITEEFSIQEYEKLQEVIEDYKVKKKEAEHLLDQLKYMKSQIEYFKNSLDKKDLQMNKLIESFQAVIQTNSERNHLEYYDKTKDKK